MANKCLREVYFYLVPKHVKVDLKKHVGLGLFLVYFFSAGVRRFAGETKVEMRAFHTVKYVRY